MKIEHILILVIIIAMVYYLSSCGRNVEYFNVGCQGTTDDLLQLLEDVDQTGVTGTALAQKVGTAPSYIGGNTQRVGRGRHPTCVQLYTDLYNPDKTAEEKASIATRINSHCHDHIPNGAGCGPHGCCSYNFKDDAAATPENRRGLPAGTRYDQCKFASRVDKIQVVQSDDNDCESSSDCVSGNCCSTSILSSCAGNNCCLDNTGSFDKINTESCEDILGGHHINPIKKNINENCWRDNDCNSGLCRTSKGKKSDTLPYPKQWFGPKLGTDPKYNDLKCRVKEGSNCSGNVDCLYPSKCIFDIDDKGTCLSASSCEDKVAELCPFIGSPLDESGVLPPGINPGNRKKQCLQCITRNRAELMKSDCQAEDFDKICDIQSEGSFFKKYCQDDGKACTDLHFKSPTQNNCKNTHIKDENGKIIDSTGNYCTISNDSCVPLCSKGNCRSNELLLYSCDYYDGKKKECLNAYSGGLTFNNQRCIYDDNTKKCNNSRITCH